MTSNRNFENKKKLEAFVSDPILAELENTLNSLNLMEAFGISFSETSASSFLAWLFNPKENHGLGIYFLKYFLMKCANLDEEISEIDIDRLHLDNAVIKTEENFRGKRADITIKVENDEEKFLCLIENKIRTTESDRQTIKYAELAKIKYPDHKKLFVFLSPKNLEAQSKEFISINYEFIRNLLDQTINANHENLNEETNFLLNQFKSNVEVNILDEGKIKELCDEIYKRHEEAINIIMSNKTQYTKVIKKFLDAKLSSDWKTHNTKSAVYIFKNSWYEAFKDCLDGKIPFFTYYISSESKKGNLHLSVHFYVLKPRDENIRKQFNKYLDDLFLNDPKPFHYNKNSVPDKFKKVVLTTGYENDDDLKFLADEMKKLIDHTIVKIDEAAKRLKEKIKN